MSRGRFRRRKNDASTEGMAATLRRHHPEHFRIARAALGVLLFTIIAKVAVAAREIVLAWRFGRGEEVDAYNLALTFSTWLPLALVSVMTIVLVPVLVRSNIENAGNRARFLRELSACDRGRPGHEHCDMDIGAVVGQWVGAGLPEATRDLFRLMLKSLAPVSLLTVMVGVYATRLQAANDHRYALAEGFPSLAVVFLLLAWQSGDAAPLIVGTLAGFAWQVGWLARRSRDGSGGSLRFALSMQAPQWKGLWTGALVMGVGQLAMSFTQPIDQWFAASVGSGAIATLGYANRIISLGMTLGATVMSRATLPIFSEGIARGEDERTRSNALGWAGLMLAIGVAAAALVWLVAPWLISVVFERGAFSATDTEAVADALRWGVWQLPPYLGGLVLVSHLASAGRYRLIGIIAVGNTSFKLVATYVLTPQLGVNGILLATALMYFLAALLCWWAVIQARDRGPSIPA